MRPGPHPQQLPHPLLFNQVVDIPEALLEDHDLTVDYILTPTRVITTGCERPKPAGIAWSKVGHVRWSEASAGLWLTDTSSPCVLCQDCCPQACVTVC